MTLATKQLLLMRHAQAAPLTHGRDFDRTLTETGHEQAAQMGRWLVQNTAEPDSVLASAALRTRQTAAWVGRELGEVAPTPRLDQGLYNASAAGILALINHVPETVTRLLVVAHLPGVQDVAMRLASVASNEDAVLDLASHYPPGSLAVLEFEGSWDTLDGRDARVTAFVTPRD